MRKGGLLYFFWRALKTREPASSLILFQPTYSALKMLYRFTSSLQTQALSIAKDITLPITTPFSPFRAYK